MEQLLVIMELFSELLTAEQPGLHKQAEQQGICGVSFSDANKG